MLSVMATIVVLSHVWVVRWDLTDDKHYSLRESSKKMLSSLDNTAEVTLLLGGDLNAGFRRLKKATEETLEELAVDADIRLKDEASATELLHVGRTDS